MSNICTVYISVLKNLFMSLLAMSLIWNVNRSFAGEEKEAVLKESKHCVSWKTKKRMMLLKMSYPVGENCNIKTHFEKVSEGVYQFVGEFPITSFDSGEKDRDIEVLNILSAKDNPNLLFVSEKMSLKKWKELLENKEGVVAGELQIGKNKFSISPVFKVSGTVGKWTFIGELKTDFSNFKISPPSVAGGLVAKVQDFLELHFQFQQEKIKGLTEALASVESSAGEDESSQ